MIGELVRAGWVKVTGSVFVRTSRRELTNSVLLVGADGALLIDPAWDPDELEAIATSIAAAGVRITGGFATHAHHDHLLWHPGLGHPPRWASHGTVAEVMAHRTELSDALAPDFPPELRALLGQVRPVDELPAPFTAIEMVVHDGHAIGHTALFLSGPRVLVAGDMLSDVELPMAARTPRGVDPMEPLDAYLSSLDLLARWAARARFVIPGHGRVGSEPEHRVSLDKRYWRALLAGGSTLDPRLRTPGMQEVDGENAHLAELYRDRKQRRHSLGIE